MKLLILLLFISLTLSAQPPFLRALLKPKEAKVEFPVSEVPVKPSPHFEINLDQNPLTRWDIPTRQLSEQIKVVHDTIMGGVPTPIVYFFWAVSQIMDMQVQAGANELSHEKYLEYKGMAEVLGVPTHEIMLCNFAYELKAYCTSIVAHDKSGNIIHGRNMDYFMYESMQDLTYTADFIQNGRLLFRATMFGGFTGVFTAMKPGRFAITINARHYHRNPVGLLYNLYLWLTYGESPATLLKNVCIDAKDFSEAKHMLATYPLTSPVYLTISGIHPDEGAIITRDRSKAADIWLINEHSPTDWAIVQTNYDHWINPSPDSDKDRANTAKAALQTITKKNINGNRLLKEVLQKNPVWNKSTLYSTIMIAKTDYFQNFRYQ